MSYKHKRSSVAGKVPAAANFDVGEILVNTADGRAFVRAGAAVKTLPNSDDVSAAAAAAAGSKLPNSGGSFTGGYSGPAPSALTGASVTPSPVDGNVRTRSNTGAWTLNAPTVAGSYTIAIIVTNAGSGAGAMTASGFHKVHGTFSIDANKKQTLIIEVYGTGHKVLTIRDDT